MPLLSQLSSRGASSSRNSAFAMPQKLKAQVFSLGFNQLRICGAILHYCKDRGKV
jgi:hypothetical protein